MKLSEFKEISQNLWNKYLAQVSSRISDGTIRIEGEEPLFPQIALVTETEDKYIFEMFGAVSKFSGLKYKRHRERSVVKYLFQFDDIQDKPMVRLNSRANGFINLCLARQVEFEKLKERFPFADRLVSGLTMPEGEGSVLAFGESFQSCFLDNCIIINIHNGVYRVKDIFHAMIVSKNFSAHDYESDLVEILQGTNPSEHLYGIRFYADAITKDLTVVGQFANIFLTPNLRETTIGEFVNTHPHLITSALRYNNLIYEPELKWIEGNEQGKEQFINPDLMLEREDGFFDICDLKTAQLDKQKITKGTRARRRFIDYVEEGIAQLANYENYFTYSKNQEYAEAKYGIRVQEPNLLLVVGSYENASREEIEEASRKLKPNYSIIDYDTMSALFIASTK